MQQAEPMARSFATLMNQIQTGAIKIPQFQRNFVWNRQKCAKLLDSLLKGYPIGTFILWKTQEELRSVRNLGSVQLPPTPKGDYVQYVLDGQQRLTSLFASVNGLEIDREGHVDDFSQLYIDLAASGDADVVVTDISLKEPDSCISVTQLLHADFTVLAQFPKEFQPAMQAYKKTLEGYNFSVILVPEAPIDVATEIFTRINVTGQPLSVFEIMVAKTFSADRDFDLAERTSSLLQELSDAGYGTVPDIVILQTVAALMVKECAKRDILALQKDKFIDAWEEAAEAIRATVDYLRSVLRIPVSQLLPYKALVVPFAYFFSKHPNHPAGEMKKHLVELFWRVSLGGYYSSLETRLAQDLRRVDAILEGKSPEYDYPIDTSSDFVLQNGYFNTGRSFVKAILCLLAARKPRSFIDDADVYISNDWLKRANSRNYHHFFPRGYLKRVDVSDAIANHIANITIVDEHLNKSDIKDKKPSVYMKMFSGKNPDLTATMKTHLISLDTFGIWEDDYARFLKQRCASIARSLTSRIVAREIDQRREIPTMDDVEEAEVTDREAVVAD